MQTDHPITDRHYGMAAIVRADLPLPTGALAAMAGHAFVSAWLQHGEADPRRAAAYASAPERKRVLAAPGLETLHDIAARAQERRVAVVFLRGAPRAGVLEPEIAALGLGPMAKADWNTLTRGCKQITGAMPTFEPKTPQVRVDFGDMVLVPRVPTSAMCDAAGEAMQEYRDARGGDWAHVSRREETRIRWTAMLARWQHGAAPPNGCATSEASRCENGHLRQ